ncbi:MAG: hypothetical protein EPO21_02100 [Chloroflexota bacterium]|nr:MAG: hypothetical protein EPO21_02100 [Chloroflexota bacterium]
MSRRPTGNLRDTTLLEGDNWTAMFSSACQSLRNASEKDMTAVSVIGTAPHTPDEARRLLRLAGRLAAEYGLHEQARLDRAFLTVRFSRYPRAFHPGEGDE